MNLRPVGPVVRAAIAGAIAMAAFGIVEIWFSELAVWAFHRAAFAPLEVRFAVALFLLYPLAGALAATLVASCARAFSLAVDGRAASALVVLLAYAVFGIPAYTGGSLVLLAVVNAFLTGAALVRALGVRDGAWTSVLSGPWTVALLLCAPAWVMTDALADAPRLVRAVGFAAAAVAVVVAAFVVGKRAHPVVFAAATAVALFATVVAVSFAGPDPPQQAAAPAAPPARGPNVLLVVLDTVRADHLSLYGYARETTPRLTRFAESATVYARAIAPSNMTLATHASLFTGLAASQHGAHYDAGRPAGRPLGPGLPTLAEIFVKRGYDVSSVAGNYGFLGRGFGLDRGFSWIDARPRRSTLGVIPGVSVRGAFRRLLCRLLGFWREVDTRARGADEITDLAIGRIDHARSLGRPYFLFVNYFDAHERVLVPPPFAGSYSSPPGRPTGALFDALLREMNGAGRVTLAPRDREDLVARYDETLAYVDASLDRLLAHASGGDGGEDTLIIVTSDHGEAWGEHEAIGHGSSAYLEQVWVPLVVKKPHQRAKNVVEGPVGLGGLFGLAAGDADELPADAPVVSESFPLVPSPEKPGVRGGRALFSGDDKIFRRGDGRVELYEFRKDPGEHRDLAGDPHSADVVARLTASLDAWIASHPPVRSPETQESREDRARLRALGYLR